MTNQATNPTEEPVKRIRWGVMAPSDPRAVSSRAALAGIASGRARRVKRVMRDIEANCVAQETAVS